MSLTPERKRELRDQARALVKKYGVNTPPVPIERIAKSMNISIRHALLDEDLSGMAFIKDSVSVIAVNALHHPNRQRFTIAHELAHHIIHAPILASGIHVDKVILRRDELTSTGTDNLEIEANTFASEMLMPRHLISSIVGQTIDLNDEIRLTAIARRFKVSIAALQFRLSSLD